MCVDPARLASLRLRRGLLPYTRNAPDGIVMVEACDEGISSTHEAQCAVTISRFHFDRKRSWLPELLYL
jgi:hypothetical protein